MELFTDKIEEQRRGERVYSLFGVHGVGARGFILCIEESGESAMEYFDGSEEQARELFRMIADQELAACHLFDAVFDSRRVIQLQMF